MRPEPVVCVDRVRAREHARAHARHRRERLDGVAAAEDVEVEEAHGARERPHREVARVDVRLDKRGPARGVVGRLRGWGDEVRVVAGVAEVEV